MLTYKKVYDAISDNIRKIKNNTCGIIDDDNLMEISNSIKNKMLEYTKGYARRIHVARSLLGGKKYYEIEWRPKQPLMFYGVDGTIIFIDKKFEKIYENVRQEWIKVKNDIKNGKISKNNN